MSDVDELRRRIQQLEHGLARANFRIGSLEAFIEANFEPPAKFIEVTTPAAIGAAAELGQALGEARDAAKGAKASARGLRRIVAPEDDTGQHELPGKDRNR